MSRQLSGLLPGTGSVRLTVDDGLIVEVQVTDAVSDPSSTRFDGELLLPGLIDLQVNGYAGVDFNDAHLTTAAVRIVVEKLWALGVTGFCPTVITGPPDRMASSVQTITAACREDDDIAASVMGVHLEGPWISPLDGARGAHALKDVRPPDLAELRTLTTAGDVAILTLAPELAGAPTLIASAVAAGVKVSVGHSAALPDDVRIAVESGATLSTHLGNGVPMTLPRHPNLIWQQLYDERLTCMFIADGHHLDLATLTAMARAKGAARWMLVSDVTAIGGMPVGEYRTPVGGLVELTADGRLGMVGTGYLAGAARPLIDGLARMLRVPELPAADVMAAVSSVPARVLADRASGRGRIAEGQRADLVRARWNSDRRSLTAVETISGGRTMWLAESW
ncbi:MAG TPA: amidohydrolase family protein [Acidothermaceae bacterium]